jgi:voltage-gated potassium channel
MENRIRRKGFTPRVAASIIATLWALGVVIFGIVERLVDPDTFNNIWLGMWWALQTVTTVGYGDVVPASTVGKVIASFLMLGGLSFFAVITGAITSAFVTQAQKRMRERPDTDDPVIQRLNQMATDLDAMKSEISRLRSGSH